MEGDAERRGHVAHGVERAIVRHDLEYVPRTRAGEPHARAHRDAKVAPVADAGGRRAVEQLGAVSGQHARRLVADHAPVADREEFGAPAEMIDGQTLDHPFDVPGVTRVLDVEEDRVPGRRAASLRRGRWDARGEYGLRRVDGHGELGLGRDDQLGVSGGDLGGGTRFRGAASAEATGRRSFHARIIRDAAPTGQARRGCVPRREAGRRRPGQASHRRRYS